MDTWPRIDLSRFFAAAACLALAMLAWAWEPASFGLWLVHIAAAPGFFLASLGVLLGGRKGAFVGVAVWCELMGALLVVWLLFLIAGGPSLPIL